MTRATIEAYYAAFNAGDAQAMLDCVTDDIEHRVNEGAIRLGKDKLAEFCSHMGVSYRETLKDMVIFLNGLPLITLKWAMTLDGKIGTATVTPEELLASFQK